MSAPALLSEVEQQGTADTLTFAVPIISIFFPCRPLDGWLSAETCRKLRDAGKA